MGLADYSLTLSYNNQAEVIEFPVLPEKIEVQMPGDSKSYEISKLGEVNVIKTRKLSGVSFESFFPAAWYPGCNVTERELFAPERYLSYIEKWRDTKKPMRLVFVGDSFNINMPVSIEDFTLTEEGGAVGDVGYSISFKEYKFYAARKVKVVKAKSNAKKTAGKKTTKKATSSAAKKARPDTRVRPKTYKVQPGDSLWKIAKKVLGDGSKASQIQKLNGIKDSELKKLKVGRVLKMP